MAVMPMIFTNRQYLFVLGILLQTAASPSPRFSFPSLQKNNRLSSSYSKNALEKWYTRPPHDSLLYDTLNVPSNATLEEIQRSWRRLSREWHPDKVAVRRTKRRGVGRHQRDTSGAEPGRSQIREEERQRYPNSRESTGKPLPSISDAVVETQIPPPPPPLPLQPTSFEQDSGDNNVSINGGIGDSSTTTKSHQNDEDEQSDDDDEEYARQKLEELTNAYDLLSDDNTRLLYHRYGLIGGTEAALQLLAGQAGRDAQNVQAGSTTPSDEQRGLLELMGYPPGGYSSLSYTSWPLPCHHSSNIHDRFHSSHHHAPHHSHSTTPLPSAHQQQDLRLAYLKATMTERLRPLVEGTVSQDIFVDNIYRECNALKKAALGSQILRCIGRAYRIEGCRVLRAMHNEKGKRNSQAVADLVLDRYRDAKHLASAALSSGRLALMEQRLKKLDENYVRRKWQREEERRRKADEEKEKPIRARGGRERRDNEGVDTTLFTSNIGEISGEDTDVNDIDCHFVGDKDHTVCNIGAFDDKDDEDFHHLFYDDDNNESKEHDELEQELQHVLHQKTYSALLSAIQIEALWKITKIELDRTIREACRWILEPAPMMLGNHRPPPSPNSVLDGWVGTTEEVVSMEVGRRRAAAAMILMGDIMVQCSKEVTAWKK